MNICRGETFLNRDGEIFLKHKEIIFDKLPCPLCWALEIIDDYKRTIKKLDEVKAK